MAIVQFLAALTFLLINEAVDAGKYTLVRSVANAHAKGGDPTAEALNVVRELGKEFYYPSLCFGLIAAAAALMVAVLALWKAK